MKNKETLLKIKNVTVKYGGVTALDDVSVGIDDGEIVALLGTNGAGKSTVIKAMFGLAPIHQGDVLWHEKEISPKPFEMGSRGISYVPQGRQLFTSLSVRENLEIGGIILPNKSDLKSRMDDVIEFFPALKSKLNQRAGTLSGGQQQMVAIGRGLMSDPKVLLLDEPSLGLAPKIVIEVFEKIKEINEKRGVAVMVVEHNVKSFLRFAHRAYVLDKGKVAIDENDPISLLSDDRLEKVFLGKSR